jgi:hypothetical protein
MQGETIESIASGAASLAFVTELMRDGGQPLTVATVSSDGAKTIVVVGKTGLSASLERLTANCR